MPLVSKNSENLIRLPADFVARRRLPPDASYWLYERNGEMVLLPRVPDVRKLYIEATTGCNLQCRTCIRSVWSDPLAQMKSETFENIMRQVDAFPELKRVVFTSFGEPLTHPRILDMIAAVRAKGLQVTLGSNGLLLRPRIARELIRLGVDRLVVSIDGANPETYADIRGATLGQIIDNIEQLNALKHEMRAAYPTVASEFVMLKSNAQELPELANLAQRLNITRILVSNVLPYSEDMRSEIMYSHEPVKSFQSRGWSVNTAEWVAWANLEMPNMHWGAERRCRFVHDHSLVVGWDGGITPCYALSHNYSYFAIDGVQKSVSRYLLGNVNESALAEAWMSEEYTCFRSEVKNYHFPSCPDCDLRETCDLRLKNEGCWGWNPSCADCLWSQGIIRCP